MNFLTMFLGYDLIFPVHTKHSIALVDMN